MLKEKFVQVWQREELQNARCWSFTPTGPGPEKSPQMVIEELMQKLRQMDTRSLAHLGALRAMPAAQRADLMTKQYQKTDDAYNAELERQLELQGFSEFLDGLNAKLEEENDAAEPEQNRSVASEEGSQTARATAVLRMMAHRLRFGPDSLAVHFCGSLADQVTDEMLECFTQLGFTPGTSEKSVEMQRDQPWDMIDSSTYMQVRTCFGDDAVRAFTECNPVCNVVLLGAGFDTKFYRIPVPDTANCIEIDAAPTQRSKIADLDAAQVDRSHVVFLPVDFETQKWYEVLTAAADVTLPTIFIWEGVTMYLSAETVLETLQQVGQMAHAAIFFDFFPENIIAKYRATMREAGEAFKTSLTPERIGELFAAVGLQTVEMISPLEGTRRYMPVRSDTGEHTGLGSTLDYFVLGVAIQSPSDRQL